MEVEKCFSTHTMPTARINGHAIRHVYGGLTGKWTYHWPQMEAIYSACGRGSWESKKLDSDWLMNTGRATTKSFGKSIIFRYNKPFGQTQQTIWKCCFIKGNMETVVFTGKGSI